MPQAFALIPEKGEEARYIDQMAFKEQIDEQV
jgi:hypothetical protein